MKMNKLKVARGDILSCLTVMDLVLFTFVPSVWTAFSSSDVTFILEIQDAFCTSSLRCSQGPHMHSNYSADRIPIRPPFMPSETCCKPCSCNRTSCHLEGTCCPDILDYLPSKAESIATPQIKCKYPQLRDGHFFVRPRAGVAFKMYNKCPKDYGASNALNNVTSLIVSKCERNDDFNDIASKVPVTAKETVIIYQNKYCAICHGIHETELMPWTAVVKCREHVPFLPSSLDTLVSEIEQRRDDCNILYMPRPVPEVHDSDCFPAEISSCNVTGLWQTYDAVLEAACHAYRSVFLEAYKNVFCYLCNIETSMVVFNVGKCSSPYTPPVHVSFSFLLKYDVEEAISSPDIDNPLKEHEQCTDSQIYDSLTADAPTHPVSKILEALGFRPAKRSKETCRNISCRPLWTLVNKECIGFIEGISGVHYDLFVKLERTTPSGGNMDVRDIRLIQEYVNKKLAEFKISAYHYKYMIYISNLSSVSPNSLLAVAVSVVVHITVMSTVDHPVTSSMIDRFLSLHNMVAKLETDSSGVHIYKVSLGTYEELRSKSGTLYLFDPIRKQTFEIVEIYLGRNWLPNNTPNNNSVLLTEMYKCPFLFLGKDEFNITFTSTGIYSETLKIHWTKDQFIIDNGQIRICMDTYKAMINEKLQNKTHVIDQHVVVTVKGVLSFVCSSLSIIFALISLLTYSLFKSLRTQPGINNMGLLISLIAAQTLFVFGVGQVFDTTSLLCKVLGIFVHYAWLLVTFWTNVCSFHVFRVFKNNTKCDSPAVSTTLYYCLYCCIGSAIPVLINVLVSLAESGFTSDHIGYGGTLCYISLPEMVIYVFAVPVGILVVMNIAFFVVVVVKLVRTKSMASSSHVSNRRNYLKIYAKLSTLTGTTWLFGILYTFTSVEAFEYIFIILTAGHGTFIFVSFLCNARVWQMYKCLANKYTIRKSNSSKSSISQKTSSSNLKSDDSRYSNQSNDSNRREQTIM